ncbi:GNAT family N-acetyltransferase [Planococcus faecalis]|uniref:GNAT family N-acetyltransferase n=1 Tax=Planococcus faecalis TaxID=1598147 RepID=A0ABM6IU88_9BACL|nr:GNAT family protein [Planococcus faecalis]AQU79530.1 GNAT family N-acetyltransferase [Planococcus faecalis]
MYKDEELAIRPVEERDLPVLWELIYKEDAPEWKKWDAPYFPHKSKPYEKFLETAPMLVDQENFWVITSNDIVCGIVSYYFEDEHSKWLEVGIVIHEGRNWNKGIGTRSLRLWLDHIFNSLPLVRVGLTTWSGNERMIRVGEKLGMQLEARIRKVRFYEDNYYDSIRMGILREEWEALDLTANI